MKLKPKAANNIKAMALNNTVLTEGAVDGIDGIGLGQIL